MNTLVNSTKTAVNRVSITEQKKSPIRSVFAAQQKRVGFVALSPGSRSRIRVKIESHRKLQRNENQKRRAAKKAAISSKQTNKTFHKKHQNDKKALTNKNHFKNYFDKVAAAKRLRSINPAIEVDKPKVRPYEDKWWEWRLYTPSKVAWFRQPKKKRVTRHDNLVKRQNLVENIKYFKTLDSIYDSFYLGKLISMFTKKGQKKLAVKQMRRSLLLLKFVSGKLPSLYLLEMLAKIKPLFSLNNWFLRRRVLVYPKPMRVARQYSIALQWLHRDILKNYMDARIATPFSQRVANKFIEFDKMRRHPLLRKRAAQFSEACDTQDNIRFSWWRRRK